MMFVVTDPVTIGSILVSVFYFKKSYDTEEGKRVDWLEKVMFYTG